MPPNRCTARRSILSVACWATRPARSPKPWSGFASLLTAQGRFEEAEALLRESLEIRRGVHGEEQLDVAKAMEDLGMNLFDQGIYEAAETMLRDSNAMRRRLLHDSPHPQLADGLNNLALVLWDQGRFEEAELLYREALEMNKVLLDDYHPTIAANMNNLAVLLHDMGDFDAAEPMYRDVITARRKTLGNEHPEVALALNNLAYLLYDRGDREAAMSMQREAIDMYRAVFPDGHPDLASSLSAFGSWLSFDRQYVEAGPLLDEAVAMGERILGADHVQVAVSKTHWPSLSRNRSCSGRRNGGEQCAPDSYDPATREPLAYRVGRKCPGRIAGPAGEIRRSRRVVACEPCDTEARTRQSQQDRIH